MKKLNVMWAETKKTLGLFNDKVTEVQRIEMRRAFYCGVSSLFVELITIPKKEFNEKNIDQLKTELMNFWNEECKKDEKSLEDL